IASAFATTEHPAAEHSATIVRERLDRYGEVWIAGHRETCEATRARGEQCEALLARRMACLEERRRAVGALVDVLSDADPTVVDRSADAVAGLPDLSRCSNVV